MHSSMNRTRAIAFAKQQARGPRPPQGPSARETLGAAMRSPLLVRRGLASETRPVLDPDAPREADVLQ